MYLIPPQESFTLPPCHISSYPIGFGYCRLTKQYKVVQIFQDFFKFATPVKAAVITVGAPPNSWRIIESSPPYKIEWYSILVELY